jgi:hypothetical protein
MKKHVKIIHNAQGRWPVTVGKVYEVVRIADQGSVVITQDDGTQDTFGEWTFQIVDKVEEQTLNTDDDTIQSTIDKHYSFNYTLSEEEKKEGSVKIDPYFVAKQWQLGKRDDTGVLFHCLKTLARFGDKNPVEREIVALYKQVVRLAELEGVSLS